MKMQCGRAIVLGVLLAARVCAQEVGLEFPLERQVFQRNAQEYAEVKVAGFVPTNTTLVEARAALGPGLRGEATEWTVVATGTQIKDHHFSGSIKLATGGWYALAVRFRRSADDEAVLGEASVAQVGVGDIYITAGQSNSANFGRPRQTSLEPLSVFFDGTQFTPAADPMPGACGRRGSPWPILGDLLSRTIRAPVCFRSATVNWLRVRDWVPGAESGNIERLVERAQWFGPSGVRAVLWVQGEADAGGPDFTPAEQYEQEATAMIAYSREKLGWPIDWFVAANSYCPPKEDEDWAAGITAVLNAQKALWEKSVAFRGPDTTDLVGSTDYRCDGIHFGQRGLQVHAERWYAALSAHYNLANPVTSRE